MKDTTKFKPILITGANSGIGRKTLEMLIDKGYFVYAGARKEKDIEELNKLPNTLAIKLDVTNDEQVKQAINIIKKEGRGLYGLVNNAGIGVAGPIITTSMEMMKDLFEVNVYGPHRMTLACFPLLRKSKGRIVNISSISGILTGRILGLYSMSKHALEAYSDTLIQNVADFDMNVSVIEPGNFKSDIGSNLIEKMRKEEESYRINLTTAQRKQQFKEIEEGFSADHGFPEPFKVAEAIFDALSSEKPKPRYLVCRNEEEVMWVIKRMFVELLQLNYDHEFSFDKEALVDILEECISELKEKN
ncbi:MAG: SDR family oxidoreductase [Candidatus Heimdallarchaeota archaeon]|nr:SDR family oxidoreductase [Candidatus Heimdallarchaeota archaeon]